MKKGKKIAQSASKGLRRSKRRLKRPAARAKVMAKPRARAKGKPRRVAEQVPNLRRLRALFALRKLERQLSSDVMSDDTIAKTFEFSTHRPANLGRGIKVNQDRLFNAFRDVLSGKAVNYIVDDGGKRLRAKVSIVGNGTAQILIKGKGYAFAYAGLLSANHDNRLGYLERYLKERTLAAVYVDEVRSLVCKEPISDHEFLAAVGILAETPESFVQSIRAKVASRDLSNADLLPEHDRHWDNLVAPWKSSTSLEEFLRLELAAERGRAFAENANRAFFAASLSCCAPGLVPLQEVRALTPDTILDIAERASSLSDHFAVTSAFEICADGLSLDARLEAAGTKLLDQLLGDMAQFKDRCAFFAAIFMLTQARLAQHQHHRRKPAFWRRLTSAANASLVTRACGTDNAERLFNWAAQHSGKPFVFSTLLEGASEPRWKADWLSADHLIADAFGRIEAAVMKIPEELRPSEWASRIDKAREFIAEHHLQLHAVLPAIGESARRPQPALEDTAVFRESFVKFVGDPTVANLIDCTPGIYLVGIPNEVVAACQVVAGQLLKESVRLASADTRFALQLLSFVSVLSQDGSLADTVAQFAIERVRELPDEETTLDLLCRVVECSSAYSDRAKAAETLGKRLEGMAFLANPSASSDLHDSLSHLQLLSDDLSQRLGRALAVARLGRRAA